MVDDNNKRKRRLFWLIPFQAFVGFGVAAIAAGTHLTLGRLASSLQSIGATRPDVSPAQGICEASIAAGLFMIISSVLFWQHIRRIETKEVPNQQNQPIAGKPRSG